MEADALTRFRAEKDDYFRTSPDSPLDDATFVGLRYYPSDPAFVVDADLEPFGTPQTVMLETNTGEAQPYRRYARASFTLSGQACTLTLYQPTYSAEIETGTATERFFVPFRDATSGAQTYGAGRYLEAGVLPDGRVLLDFNYAYHPFCAYSPRYRCPLPPAENWLEVPVYAGEKL